MRSFRRHPSFLALSEYVDLGERQPDWRQVRSHLRECTLCRDQVAWLRRLSEEASKLGPVKPPEGTIERVLARRAAGERVILPAFGPVESDDAPPPGSTWLLALAAAALFGLSAIVFLAPEATAGSNNLHFQPSRPSPGEVLRVHYRPTTGLAGADSLRLRARFRGVGQERGDPELPGGWIETILRPDEDGIYVGTIEIPAVAAYGQMVVEDTEATFVDSNNGRPWEVLTYDEDGVRYEALRQRLIANSRYDWRRVVATARRMTDAFPGRPEAWYNRLAAERQFVDTGAADSLLRFHRGVLDRLQVDLSASDPSPSDIAYLAAYASVLDDETASEFWKGTLARRAPRHPGLFRLRAYEVFASGEAPATVLARIDSLWARSDHGEATVAELALGRAVAAKDHEWARIWARRLGDLRPAAWLYIGRRLGTDPATRPDAILHLRGAADRLRSPDAPRPLREDAESWKRIHESELREVLLELGRALLADASRDAARDALHEAVALDTHSGDAAADLAELALALGDTVMTVRLLAAAAADPLAADSVARRGSEFAVAAGLPLRRWRKMLAGRRDRLARATLQAAAYRVLPPELDVGTSAGESRPLRDLAAGRPTLLAVRAVHSPASAQASIEELEEIHTTAERRGHRLVALLLPWRGYAPDPFLSGDVPFPVVHDRGSDVADALGVWNRTAYVVLDADGVFRGKFLDAGDAFRLLSFLPAASLTA